MSRVDRWLRILLLPLWSVLLWWKFIDIWTWRSWFWFGIDLFLIAMYSWFAISYVKIVLRNQRHIRLRPFPFPTPDVWPDLPKTLNAAQQMAEDAAEDPDPLYFIDVTYKPEP